MPPRSEDTAWVAQHVLRELRWSEKPPTRDELTCKVLQHALYQLGIRWKSSTAGRRVREALEALLDSDTPVISAGGGFKLAATATAAERERAAQICERVARKEWLKARKIRALPLPGDPADGDLFPEYEVRP